MRHRVAAASAALLLPTLVGCAGDEAPEASPATSATSSSSATASSAPALPPAAQGTGPKAAEAFVRHYVDLINHGLATLDGEPLRNASHDECEPCVNLAQAVEKTRQADGRYEGGRWRLSEVSELSNSTRSFAQVRAMVTIGKVRIVQQQPRRSAEFPPQRTVYTFTLDRSASGALVRNIHGLS